MRYFFLGVLLATMFNVSGQTISGRILSNDGPIPFANVYLKGTTEGATSNDAGYFELTTDVEGEQMLQVSALGYKPWQKKLTLSKGKLVDVGDIILEVSSLGLDEVVITGTLKESFISESPVKVEVVTTKFLQRNASTDLVRGISRMNGVQEVVACGVCFTNSISINGLEGPYTAVLIDGSPMYGNLASVYGLNGIPTTMIDRIEVVKGPASTLFGSEAMAGVINVITKDPDKQPLISIDLLGNFPHQEYFVDMTTALKLKRGALSVGGNYAYVNIFEDKNGDGFSDVVNMDRANLMLKYIYNMRHSKRFTISAKAYYEDRRNGVAAFLNNRAYKQLRGNDSIYGESIYTYRGELFGSLELPIKENIRLDYSFNWHHQNSYYGSDFYQATQSISYIQALWLRTLGRHSVSAGATLRYQYYDDNTIATSEQAGNSKEHQFIPGVFVQDEWRVHEKVTLLAGVRVDHYHSHGVIFSPRFSTKYKPARFSTLRLNFGTGFRVVNLFTEDHAFVSGNREVVIEGALKPERSYNLNLNFNQILAIGRSQAMLDLDGFVTYFTNAIVPDYDTPGQIVYANTGGHLLNYGVSATYRQEFAFPLDYNIGGTLQWSDQSFIDDNGKEVFEPVQFVPRWSLTGAVNYRIRKIDLEFSYTFTVTGPMSLPEVYDVDANTGEPLADPRSTLSETFSIHNLQVLKNLPLGFVVYTGVRNLFNYVQPVSPLTGYNDPNAEVGFSDHFDTSYAYGPLHGREFYVGVKWRWK